MTSCACQYLKYLGENRRPGIARTCLGDYDLVSRREPLHAFYLWQAKGT
jgi:hypothetical protein